ncbi:hypothetical protein PT974_00095 [Cladobotryum mycophilum]|uniref:Oxidase ustYa n=1 Tax=Cladobotryum mycophilum TaxID=491253 RepID=A0ABR0SZV5_9HYPO
MLDVKWSGQRRSRPSLSAVFVVLPLTILAICVVILYSFIPFRDLASCPETHVPALPDKNDVKNRLVLFEEKEEYKNLSHEYDSSWNKILGPNGGFLVKLDENDQRHHFGISMFHQMHCLIMIRGAVQALYSKLEQAGIEIPDVEERGEHSHADHFDSNHWLHCFDYLRQTLLCNADGTVERPRLNTHGVGVVDGMGERKCRDWDALYELSKESIKNPEKVGKIY